VNNQPRVLNFDDVIDLCGSVATSRGQVYKTSGAVKEVDWIPDGDVLYAVVQDTEAEQYHVRGGRDRNAGYPAPLAQIPASAANAPGSCLEFWRQSELPDTDG